PRRVVARPGCAAGPRREVEVARHGQVEAVQNRLRPGPPALEAEGPHSAAGRFGPVVEVLLPRERGGDVVGAPGVAAGQAGLDGGDAGEAFAGARGGGET